MSHEEIKKLLPHTAKEMDTDTGQLPLHTAILSKKYPHHVLVDILEAYPEAAKIRDKLWRLPLHCALEGTPAPSEFVLHLIRTYPSAAMLVDTQMYLPLHVAMESSPAAPIEVVKALLEVYPQAVQEQTLHSFLPIHLALGATPCKCNKSACNEHKLLFHEITASVQVIEALVDAAPCSLCFEADQNMYEHVFQNGRPVFDQLDDVSLLGSNSRAYLDRTRANLNRTSTGQVKHLKTSSSSIHPLTIAVCAGMSIEMWTMLVSKVLEVLPQGKKLDETGIKQVYARTLIHHMNRHACADPDCGSLIQSDLAMSVETAAEAILEWMPDCCTTESSWESIIEWHDNTPTMLHWILSFSPRPSLDLVHRLLRADVHAVTVRNDRGMLPLHCALTGGVPANLDVITLLMEQYPDAAAMRCRYGKVPLYYAVKGVCADVGVVTKLLNAWIEASQKVKLSKTNTSSSSGGGGGGSSSGSVLAVHTDMRALDSDSCTSTVATLVCNQETAGACDADVTRKTISTCNSTATAAGVARAHNLELDGITDIICAAVQEPCAPIEVVMLLQDAVSKYANRRHLANTISDNRERTLRSSLSGGAPLEVVQLFLDPQPANAGMKLLHAALQSVHTPVAVVQYLVQTFPDSVHTPDRDSNLALHAALMRTLLMRTSEGPRNIDTWLEVVESILDAHPQAVRHKNKRDMLPLLLALEQSSLPYDVFKKLLDAYPDAIYETTPSGDSALSLALRHCCASERVIQAILQLDTPQSRFVEGVTQDGR
jgi:hypothetical protein